VLCGLESFAQMAFLVRPRVVLHACGSGAGASHIRSKLSMTRWHLALWGSSAFLISL
jgi:hypothetical protein